MKIAVPVSANTASGPGEAQEIVIIDTVQEKIVERYPNPALTATSARGISMVRSVMERKVDGLVVGGIGEHALSYAANHLKVYNGAGMTIEDLSKKSVVDNLEELTQATHTGHHHH